MMVTSIGRNTNLGSRHEEAQTQPADDTAHPAPRPKAALKEVARPRAIAGLAGDGVRAVDRALVLLRAFREDDGPLALTELSRRAGLNMTTALRLLGTLEAH